jgi:hypothetical protein
MTFTPDHDLPPPRLPWWRRTLDRVRRRPAAMPADGPRRFRAVRWLVWTVIAIALLYYPIGMILTHTIDDNVDFGPASVVAGESRAIALSAALITREVDQHHWTPMDPFFLPGGALDNMPNFQRGILTALGRFTTEMMDQLGRTRGSSQVDPDLDQARGFLNEQPNIWIWTPSVSLLPTVTSAQKYRAGRDRLMAYNRRLASGQAVFERRSDNLQALVERMANDIGSDSAVIDQHLTMHGGDLLDFYADNIFYFNKGRLYANYLLLRELEVDFQNLLRERELTRPWKQLLDTFRTAAMLQPLVVINGRADSQFLPSHLAAQGFYLLRARTQLREIRDILLR